MRDLENIQHNILDNRHLLIKILILVEKIQGCKNILQIVHGKSCPNKQLGL